MEILTVPETQHAALNQEAQQFIEDVKSDLTQGLVLKPHLDRVSKIGIAEAHAINDAFDLVYKTVDTNTAQERSEPPFAKASRQAPNPTNLDLETVRQALAQATPSFQALSAQVYKIEVIESLMQTDPVLSNPNHTELSNLSSMVSIQHSIALPMFNLLEITYRKLHNHLEHVALQAAKEAAEHKKATSWDNDFMDNIESQFKDIVAKKPDNAKTNSPMPQNSGVMLFRTNEFNAAQHQNTRAQSHSYNTKKVEDAGQVEGEEIDNAQKETHSNWAYNALHKFYQRTLDKMGSSWKK